MMGDARGFKIDRRLITILAIVFVQMLGAGMILPILPLFAKNQLTLSDQLITLIISSFFMAQFIAGPFLGRWSDRSGRLPVLLISQVGTAISFFLIGWAESAWLLFAARILDGITGGNIIVAQAYITDVTPRENRTQALGLVFAMFGLGFIFGPVLGGLLSASLGTRVRFFIAAGVATLTALLTWLVLDESLSPEQQAANREFKRDSLKPIEVLRNTSLLMILIVVFVSQFALGLLQSTFALFGDAVLFAGADEATVLRGIGILLAFVGLTQFFTQSFLLRPLLKRFGEANLIVFGNLFRVAGTAVYAIAMSPALGALASVLFPLGMGVMLPSLQSLSTNTVPDQMRGGVLGLYQSSVSLSVIFGTALGGTLFAISPHTPYWVGVVLGLLAVIPIEVVRRRYNANHLVPIPVESN